MWTCYGVERKTRSNVMLKLVKTKSTHIRIASNFYQIEYKKLIPKSTLLSIPTDTVLYGSH